MSHPTFGNKQLLLEKNYYNVVLFPLYYTKILFFSIFTKTSNQLCSLMQHFSLLIHYNEYYHNVKVVSFWRKRCLSLAVSDIVKQYEDEQGNIYYKMKTHDIEVQATQNSGLAPVITYFMGDKEITDDIRSLRFSPRPPSSYIQDYDEFQTMLYAKEQRAINELYEQMSIKPKNMSSGKQLLWSFFVIIIAMLPLLVAIWWYN